MSYQDGKNPLSNVKWFYNLCMYKMHIILYTWKGKFSNTAQQNKFKKNCFHC